MIRLAAACRKTSVSRTTGMAPDPMMSARTCPGPTDGSWSMSPTMSSAALSGTALNSACMSGTSTMEASSTTRRSQSRALPSLRLKPPALGSTSSSRWIVLASNPVASVIRLAARPVGAQSSILDALDAENAQDRLDDGGLADARPAGDDERLAGQRQPDRVALAVGEREAAALLDPGDGLQRIDRRPGKLAAGNSDQPLGDGLLGAIEAGEKHAVRLADPVGDHGAFGTLEIEGGA